MSEKIQNENRPYWKVHSNIGTQTHRTVSTKRKRTERYIIIFLQKIPHRRRVANTRRKTHGRRPADFFESDQNLAANFWMPFLRQRQTTRKSPTNFPKKKSGPDRGRPAKLETGPDQAAPTSQKKKRPGAKRKECGGKRTGPGGGNQAGAVVRFGQMLARVKIFLSQLRRLLFNNCILFGMSACRRQRRQRRKYFER